MRVIFAGTPQTAVPSLRAILDSRHEVVAVLTRPDARAGRGRALHPSPIKEVALAEGLEVLTPHSARDADLQDRLRQLAPAACPVVAYGALLPPAVLDIPQHGWINLHFSLLPAWRGAAPVQRAIMAGDEVTGACTFRIEEGLDTGPVFGAITETIRPRDTAGELLERLSQVGAGLLVDTLNGIEEGILRPIPQSADGVSQAAKLNVTDARVRWALPAHLVDRAVRGCTPAPGAWSTLRGERVGIGAFTAYASGGDLAPGEILAGKREVLVGTAGGQVTLGEVRPVGKRAMPAADWARGVRIEPGERFD